MFVELVGGEHCSPAGRGGSRNIPRGVGDAAPLRVGEGFIPPGNAIEAATFRGGQRTARPTSNGEVTGRAASPLAAAGCSDYHCVSGSMTSIDPYTQGRFRHHKCPRPRAFIQTPSSKSPRFGSFLSRNRWRICACRMRGRQCQSRSPSGRLRRPWR